jgi:diphosphomevalonate decarboxylase
MKSIEFIPKSYDSSLDQGSFSWQSPSNIALVKYWGKHGEQLPKNPSISFTLDRCRTITELIYKKKGTPSDDFEFKVIYEGNHRPDFEAKIKIFFDRVFKYLPFLKDYHFEIHTSNTFPHSSGIASSASGMSALALCLMSMDVEMNKSSYEDEYFFKKASFLSRLGSGSACRSIQGGLMVWGEHEEIEGSSDLYGIQYPYEVHEVFRNYQDTILLVDKGEKQVSSTVGHGLMNEHPFAESRFKQGFKNLERIKEILRTGDLISFIDLVESEALTLHSMMLTSSPRFILMKPNTLEIIDRIWKYRKDTSLPICFTLDAGANVHVLYPENIKETIMDFIRSELRQLCKNGEYIQDHTGEGAVRI